MIILILAGLILLLHAFWYHQLRKKAKRSSLFAKQASTSDWNTDFLESKRALGDTIADDTINKEMRSDNPAHINALFQLIRGNSEQLPDGMSPTLKKYFEDSARLPQWADEDMLRFGQQVYLQHGIFIGMLLFYKSLPECYTGAKGANVLFQSARLNEKSGNQDKYARRLAETGLFVYDAMAPNGFDKQGQAIRAVQKIRLIHAVIRFYIKKEGWDARELGEPINQEDMAGTLMAFSALILEGLQMLGVKFDDVQTESFIHCWRVIGHVMGVDADLIPANSKDALALGHAIIDHQKAKSEAGVSLTEALLEFCDRKAPFFIKKDFHRLMMTDLMGEELSEILSLPIEPSQKVKRFRKVIQVVIAIREFAEKTLLFRLPFALIDRLLLKISVLYISKNRIVSFYFPKSLRQDFKIK